MDDLLRCIGQAVLRALGAAVVSLVMGAIAAGIGLLLTVVTGGVVLVGFWQVLLAVVGWAAVAFTATLVVAIFACFLPRPAQPQAENPGQANQGLTGKLKRVDCPICEELRPLVIIATLIVFGVKFLP
jgi:hypothetical protein